jgi:hypothetical protein
VLKDWLVRTVSAALRKGDARLTLERVRQQELVEASLADMAADIVAGEQQVALTGGDRSQLNSLLHMESVAVPPETSAVEAKPAHTRRTNTRPGTRHQRNATMLKILLKRFQNTRNVEYQAPRLHWSS